MTLLRHELKQGRNSLIIWTAAIGFLLAVCVFLFPEMKGEMNEVSKMFSSMGGFTEAFGMDQVDFGTLPGFYAVECGNILGLGGAFFAALCGISALAKEEKEHTAEFLLTHPVGRMRILTEKLLAVLAELILLNGVIFLLAVASIGAIKEPIPWKAVLLLHLAYFLLQVEVAAICFGISAFIRRGSLGVGLGIVAVFYFLNIIANISRNAEFLKYITPFGYAEGSDIVANVNLDTKLVLIGMVFGALGIIVAYWKYNRKDIA